MRAFLTLPVALLASQLIDQGRESVCYEALETMNSMGSKARCKTKLLGLCLQEFSPSIRYVYFCRRVIIVYAGCLFTNAAKKFRLELSMLGFHGGFLQNLMKFSICHNRDGLTVVNLIKSLSFLK